MTETSILCPECKLPWTLVAGAFPLHTSKGSPCPMSGHLPDYVNKEPHVAPLDKAANPKPARTVRSDKGTKRRPRKGGGDSHVSTGRNDPTVSRGHTERTVGLEAAPGGSPSQAKERVRTTEPGQPNELAAPTKRKPRSDRAQYIAVTSTPVYPNQEAAEEGAKKALENRDAGCTYFVYRVREVAIAANGTYITRTGRVRKAK